MEEETEFSAQDKYFSIRSDRKEIRLGGYNNKVYFNDSEHTATIEVDDTFEFPEEYDEETEEAPKSFEPIVSNRIIQENNNSYIYRDVFELSTFDSRLPKWKVNPFAGLLITYPVGEGLIDFCLTDFSKQSSIIDVVGAFSKLKKTNKNKKSPCNDDKAFEAARNAMERIFDIKEYLMQSVYTAVFPPMFVIMNREGLLYLTNYLRELQIEMNRRIEFVFDEDYYPDELLKLTAHERFGLYSDIFGVPSTFERQQKFNVTYRMDKTTLESCRLPMDVILQRLESHVPTKEKSPLEEALGLKAGRINICYHLPLFMSAAFICSSVHEMLELEFTKMLEYSIRLHKCKICGRYFIVKGNYNAENCDRVREGHSQTCQQIAAQRRYEEKLHNDKAVALFRKYYKRYHTRSKVGTIKPDHFRLWNYQACEKRDMCQRGEITLEEFDDWLEGSFKNREKK